MSFIPVNEPDLSGNENAYASDAISSGWISSGGKYIRAFEDQFAEFCGVRHAVSTTSGTAALQLAVAALDIGPGDEVIIPALTIISTAFAVCYAGATLVLADSEPDTGNIDPQRVQEKITPRTKAIIPVHLYGQPAAMTPLRELAQAHNLKIIEDAAEAHGATYGARRAGTMGDCACFSFYANKIITTGEGGMVTTDNDAVAARVRRLKDLSHSPETRFLHTEIAYTLRMTNVQAAIGVAQLERVQEFLSRKARMAELYAQGLASIVGLELPVEREGTRNVHWMYAVRVTKEFGCSRDELMRGLKERGVDTRTFFYPMHQQPVFQERGWFKGETYPVAERLSRDGFYLPSGLTITPALIERVCEAVRDVQREAKPQ